MPRRHIPTALDPRAFTNIVGSTFANADHRPLIRLGSRAWNKWDLGRLGCPHPVAAVKVARVLHTLGITTPAAFLAAAPTFGAFRDIGVTSYWVVLALVHDLGADPAQVHGAERPSFHAIHRHALKQEQTAAHDQRRTTRARRARR